MVGSMLTVSAVAIALSAQSSFASTVDLDDPTLPVLLGDFSASRQVFSSGRPAGATRQLPIPVQILEAFTPGSGGDADDEGAEMQQSDPIIATILSLASNGRDGSRQPKAIVTLPVTTLQSDFQGSDSDQPTGVQNVVPNVPIPAAGLLLLAGLGVLGGLGLRRRS